MKKEQLLLPVSRRAVFLRVARALAKENKALHAYRRGQSGTLGDLYVVDVDKQRIVEMHADLELLGRRFGVLREFESLEPIDEDAISDARHMEKIERKARRNR